MRKQLLFLLLFLPLLVSSQMVINSYRYESSVPIPTGNLVHYYDFEDNGNDEMGNHNGTVTNATYSTGGIIGKYLALDGNSDYMTIPDNSALSFDTGGTPDGPFSLSMWIFISNTNDSSIFYSRRYGGHEYQLGWDTTGYLVFVCFSGGTTANYLQGRVESWTPTVDQWYHLVATYDGSGDQSGMNIYVDKVAQTVADYTVGTYSGMSNTSISTYVGIYGPIPTNTASHHGGNDLLGLWNIELSAEEVEAIYDKENGGTLVTE